MDKLELINFIKTNIPNVLINEHSLEIIAEQFEEKTFHKDDYLLKYGKISGYFFLSEGFLRVLTFDTEGNEITTYFYSQVVGNPLATRTA